MKINNKNSVTNNHKLVILILQFMALMNAVLLGWKVKKVESKKFIICKKVSELTELDNNTVKFLDTIMRFGAM